jgi:hypothetical protein
VDCPWTVHGTAYTVVGSVSLHSPPEHVCKEQCVKRKRSIIPNFNY